LARPSLGSDVSFTFNAEPTAIISLFFALVITLISIFMGITCGLQCIFVPISKRVLTRNSFRNMIMSIRIKGAKSIMPALVGILFEIWYVTGSTSLQIVLTRGLYGSGFTHERTTLAKIIQK
jgi:hypothetical protein